MSSSERCQCGFNFKNGCKSKNGSSCCVNTAFKNHVSFPPARLLPPYERGESDCSIYYAGDLGYNTRHWAALLQLETKLPGCSMFPRDRWVTLNTYGENILVHLYKDYSEYEKPTTFNCNNLIQGRTLAVLYPDQAMPNGLLINFINYDTCYIFNASLAQVLREGERLLNDADLKAQQKPHVCFQCGTNNEASKQCGECRLAKYCSKKCQVEHWHSGHKNLCKSSDMLLRLACLPRYKYDGNISFREYEDESKYYSNPMPKYVHVQALEQKTIESRALSSINQNKLK